MISFQKELLTVPSDMSLINMDRDPYYRYRMPQLRVGYDKNFTVLNNIDLVAKHLHVLTIHIVKHFSIELKTPYQIKAFKKRTETKLKGFFALQKLQNSLDKFIVGHLLCKQCLYPEIKYTSDVNRLKASCRACGYFEIFDPRQNQMKEFIYNNPLKKDKQQLEKEEEDDLVYGNREFEFQSSQSDTEEQQLKQQ